MYNPANGIIDLRSPYSFKETADRLEALLRAKGIKLFARIDQSAEASAVGLSLRPTILFIFGDPAKGTPWMVAHPALAMDLPLKALVWEAKPGEVYLSYTTAEFLQQRYQLPTLPFPEIALLMANVLK